MLTIVWVTRRSSDIWPLDWSVASSVSRITQKLRCTFTKSLVDFGSLVVKTGSAETETKAKTSSVKTKTETKTGIFKTKTK